MSTNRVLVLLAICGVMVAHARTAPRPPMGNASTTSYLAEGQTASGTSPSTRLADGRLWTTANLNVDAAPSYCYEDAESNCSRYGRLYTWESAQRGCASLGRGWQLPTDDHWRQMAKRYGGVIEDSADEGKAAFAGLAGAGFNATFGGSRSADGQYGRLEAHGLYWSATETDARTALFYNFGRNGQAVNRHTQGDKRMALSVRCILL